MANEFAQPGSLAEMTQIGGRAGSDETQDHRLAAEGESEQRYRTIFDAAPVSIWEEDFSRVRDALGDLRRAGVTDLRAYLRTNPQVVQDALGLVRLIDVNDASLSMFEAASKEELLSSLERIFMPETVPAFIEEVVALAEGQPLVSAETALCTLRGRQLDVLFTIRFLPDAHAFMSMIDITARKCAERRLRESEVRFRNMADNAPVMIWVTDPDAVCTYLSKSWYGFTGQTPETALGLGWVNALHPDDRKGAHEAFIAANERRERFRIEYRLRRRDSVYRWVLDSAAPRLSEHGEFLGYIGSVIDITERKETETTTQLLLAELNHRVKNTLATVQSLARQTAKRARDLPQFLPAFEGRLQALSSAHSLLTERIWEGAELSDLIRDQVLLGAADEARIEARGPVVMLGPQEAVHLALVLHELSTNARKYGALSAPGGHVSITWMTTGDRLALEWAEHGGPAVTPPTSQGFGSLLIEHTLRSHKGEARATWDPQGVIWTLTLPVSRRPIMRVPV